MSTEAAHTAPPSLRALRKESADAELRERGYCVLRDAGTAVVAALVELHQDVHPTAERGFVSDVDGATPPRKRELASRLMPFWSGLLDAEFVDHRMLVGGFLVKWPDPSSLLPLHQHWTCVDEPGTRSLTLWLALDDTSSELDNGPVLVLPRSHLVADAYFGTGTAAWYEPYEAAIWEAMVPVDMAAGDLLVMDSRLVHGSGPNRSDRPRRALGGAAAPAGAQLVHALALDDRLVEVVDVPSDFLIDHVIVRTGAEGAATATGYRSRVVRRTRRPVDRDLLRAICPQLNEDGPSEVARLPATAVALQRCRSLIDRVGGAALGDPRSLLEPLSGIEAITSIRAELARVLGAGFRPVPEHVLAGTGLGDASRGADWLAIVLSDSEGPLPGIAELAPVTTSMLAAAGGARRVTLALLPAGAATSWDQVPLDLVRADLPIAVPRRSSACRLEQESSEQFWRSGEVLVHPAGEPVRSVNYGESDLVVLRVDADRPLRGAWRVLAPLRRAAALRGARRRRRAREVQVALRPPSTTGRLNPA